MEFSFNQDEFKYYCSTTCNTCCDLKVALFPPEIERIRKKIGLNLEDFLGGASIPPVLRRGRSCYFSSNTGCTIYDEKPLECLESPHRFFINIDYMSVEVQELQKNTGVLKRLRSIGYCLPERGLKEKVVSKEEMEEWVIDCVKYHAVHELCKDAENKVRWNDFINTLKPYIKEFNKKYEEISLEEAIKVLKQKGTKELRLIVNMELKQPTSFM